MERKGDLDHQRSARFPDFTGSRLQRGTCAASAIGLLSMLATCVLTSDPISFVLETPLSVSPMQKFAVVVDATKVSTPCSIVHANRDQPYAPGDAWQYRANTGWTIDDPGSDYAFTLLMR